MTTPAIDTAFYRDNGYVVVRDVYEAREIDAVMAVIYRLYRKFAPDDAELDGHDRPWESAAFDAKLIALRAADPRVFGALYDCAQASTELSRFVLAPKVCAVAGACLGAPSEELSYSGIMLRLDAPHDRRNTFGWHQDRAYYPQNADGDHGLVVTAALHDIPATLGALRVCPKSHLEGYARSLDSQKTDYETSEQREVPAELVARYAPLDAPLRKGDVLCVAMNLIHRSGDNVTERIRYSALTRFHRMTADDYVPFGLLYQFNDFMRDRVGGDD